MMIGAKSEQTTAMIRPGWTGHDREIVVNLGYRASGSTEVEEYSHDFPIPRMVETQIVNSLPDTWKIENRGSRIEIHPSGHFAGGFTEHDVFTVYAALIHLNYFPEVLEP